MPLSLIVSRRHFFFIIGGGAVLAAGTRSVAAAETRIGRLIVESRGKGTISQRIDFLSSALRGTRYQSDTLIGGPWRSEKFVVRDDAFDCVTFCETVLAASIATNRSEFDSVLRTVRYHNGMVAWGERNHYFFRMVPAQRREQHLPLDPHSWRGRYRKDGRFPKGNQQAAICDARHPKLCFSREQKQTGTRRYRWVCKPTAELGFFPHWLHRFRQNRRVTAPACIEKPASRARRTDRAVRYG